MDRSAIRDPVIDSRRRDARKDMLRRLEIPSNDVERLAIHILVLCREG